MSGKGSNRRPTQIKDEEFTDNWSRIFGNKPERFNYLLKDYQLGFNHEETSKENNETTNEKR
jgi:hypothetical protein